MDDSPDPFEKFAKALGNLCSMWAVLDRELNALIREMLQISDAQVACLASEMNDVAPRCRLISNLAHTIDAPSEWRTRLKRLSGHIQNRLSTQRNRYIHDAIHVTPEAIMKIDRRVSLQKAKSFADLELTFDRREKVTSDQVDALAKTCVLAMVSVACARFDIEQFNAEGRFPESPQLSEGQVKLIPQFPSLLAQSERRRRMKSSPE